MTDWLAGHGAQLIRVEPDGTITPGERDRQAKAERHREWVAWHAQRLAEKEAMTNMQTPAPADPGQLAGVTATPADAWTEVCQLPAFPKLMQPPPRLWPEDCPPDIPPLPAASTAATARMSRFNAVHDFISGKITSDRMAEIITATNWAYTSDGASLGSL